MSSPPDDRFARYYAEKLWELIPGTYRHEDGTSEQPGVLRALVEIIADKAAVLRRSQDRLWDDLFIDLCDDWAVPYLGDLVDTRLVSALDKRARRIDVAKTIYYRRRKGTPRVLEELIADITGWEGKVVESFRGLARARHGLDPAPRLFGLEGRYSGTPAHGFADLRDPRTAELADGPFDEYAHLPDPRRPRGGDGRWNIPKVAFHLYRLAVEPVIARPHIRPDGVTFTFDPSGRDVPLFIERRRLDDWDDWTSALPWQVPAPMTCRLLGHAEYAITGAVVHALETSGLSAAAATELRKIVGHRLRDEAALRRQLSAMVHAAELLASLPTIRREALVADCAKHELYPESVALEVGGLDVPRDQIAAANLATWTATSAGVTALVDPDRGRGKLLGGPGSVVVRYHAGFSGDIGAGAYDRAKSVVYPPARVIPAGGGPITAGALGASGSVAITDSDTYGPVDDVAGVTTLVIEAATRTRPYVRLAGDWVIAAAAGPGERHLVLDGWWIGARTAASVVLRGTWTRVTLRHCTLDPGGQDADGLAILPVALSIEGAIDRLVLDRTIASQVRTKATGLVHALDVTDSILQAPAGEAAISLALGMTTLARTTVFGELAVERLYASEVLVTGHVEVVDTQTGCFRFSAAPPGSRLPHPFRSVSPSTMTGSFTSRRFGDPGYAQLSEVAPLDLVRGAENGSEMGAWSSLLGPIKEDSLAAKVEEYLPFGLIPSFVKRT